MENNNECQNNGQVDEVALAIKKEQVAATENVSNDNNVEASSSTSSSGHGSEHIPSTIDIVESDSDDSSTDTNYDEKIKIKENDINEVDVYLRKLQKRRNDLVAECNHLKEKKALRRSNQLAKQNWENDTFPWNADIQRTLKNVFRLNTFRPQQLKTINAIMSKYDVLLLAPTGGGKSLCYQLPALVMQGITVVVSPLIALMEDQVWTLKNLGIEAELLTSTTDRNKNNSILKMLSESSDVSVLKLLYVTPERMAKSKRFLVALQKSYFAKKLNMIAIDEVHCCSQWGHDFRPDYKFLGNLKSMFPEVPILGVTATATSKVIVDVQKMLNIRDCLVLKAPFNRPNLYYHVMEKPSEKEEVFNLLSDLLKGRYAGKSGIIYTFSIRDAEDLATELVKRGIEARPYHANLLVDRRTAVHTKWLKGLIQVVVATVAFGMGIDKPDVRFVIHHTMSKSMENFYQESGRAGRDGKRAECILLYRFIDMAKITTMMFSERTGLQNAYAIADYCIDATRCRRDIISQYFSEVWNDNQCNKMCDRCYNINSVRVPKIEISEYIFDVYKILDVAEAIDVKMTGTKIIDAWYNKGPSNLRSPDVKTPSLERYFVEQIIVFMILEKYLKEDFHFTAYSTISYIRKGPNVPKNDVDILFHGARVFKLPESGDLWDKDDSTDFGTTPKSKKKQKRRSVTENGCDDSNATSSKKKRKTKITDSSPNGSTSSAASRKLHLESNCSPKKLTKNSVSKSKELISTSHAIEMASKRQSLLDRERIIRCNKNDSLVCETTEEVIFIPDDENVIEIE